MTESSALPGAARSAEIAERLSALRERIGAAAAVAERPAPALIVVTKFHPASDVMALTALGVRDVGENRDQEAAAKAAEVAAAEPGSGLRWHFIGQLQSNKAKSVATYAHAVHSVDRAGLVMALSSAVVAERERTGREALDCLVQLSFDPPEVRGRGGARPEALPELAELIASAEGLRMAGVMAVAPVGVDPRGVFDRLAHLSADIRRSHPAATMISAGMSQDLEAAVAAGATHLRIGTDVLGRRAGVG